MLESVEKRLELLEASIRSFAATYQQTDDLLGSIREHLEDLAGQLDAMSAAMAPLPDCPPRGFRAGEAVRQMVVDIDKTREDLAVYWCGDEWKELLQC
ncbi:MAG: hypothetical protein J6R18_05650 [Kiritimatiellae bacterium]|nr:hypothetical protein [Kiritimatiellia bacterium]